MKRFLLAFLVTLLTVACRGEDQGTPSVDTCVAWVAGCGCSAQPASTVDASAASSLAACSTAAYPGTTCCADEGWPGAGGCICATNAVYCGVVADAFTNGESGCVCTTFPTATTQVVGATCYPGGTAEGDGGLGVCCLDAAGSCACGAGLHTCGSGSSEVATCSAANVTAAAPGCSAGTAKVESCTGG